MSDDPPLTEKQINALFERGSNFIRLGNLTAAVQDFTRVLAYRPDFAPAYFNRGFARQHGQADLAGAVEDYSQALRLNPRLAAAYINRAIAYSASGNFSAALADYTTALSLDPNLWQALSNRGEVYFALGDYAAAAADFRAACRLKPDYRYGLAGLAISQHALGSVADARQLWRQLIERDAKFADVAWVKTELGWSDRLAAEAERLLAGMDEP